MAGRQQPGFIERTVDELDEATDVRDFDNDDHIEGWALHKHEYIKRYQLSTCKLLRALIAFSWLKWGDEYAGSLKNQTHEELSNIALMSALVLTIWATFLGFTGVLEFPTESEDHDDISFKWCYAVVWTVACLSCFFALCGTVMLLLAVNEVPGERQVREILDLMGDYSSTPTYCWIVSMVAGSIGIGLFIRCFYGYHVAIPCGIVAILAFMMFCRFFYSEMVKAMYVTMRRLKDEGGRMVSEETRNSTGPVVLSRHQINVALVDYIAMVGAECAPRAALALPLFLSRPFLILNHSIS